MIEIVSQMRSYGENISNEIVVCKFLRTLNETFDRIIPTIEESKDLSTYTFDELMSSLLAHEARKKTHSTKVEEKAFQAKGEPSFKGKLESFVGHGQSRGSFRVEATVLVEDVVNLASIITRVSFSAAIVRRLVIRSLSVGPSKRMRIKLNLLKVLKMKTNYLWCRLQQKKTMISYGSWIVGARIICQA